ncbi:50S ribosomal protein L3 [Candidatus Desantisbacteria bacterium CG2_30_40_21]|uniref:Large ribosomal subunit protein uL3 n=6 Tax=unclassified Candidatus Desantisiibacteriota TaxID=3106372 RepID=A0A2M7P1L8_9BACT|nr:ribosomal protein L3 [uncultured bacterium]OIP43539.1 MAG: 50S ribosomal protein L3 [Candidatus Desantisbacteria bacterium CG2_30_40_21]PIP39399.1 MAG: 50S ribosomal protein L3 [Candidatus Desantisbacteria bacterium CG23_combo_of_CG06-09_8_20_14_all_40_23]PIY19571.1 MAG: 50S ribosomal protein L3 [Candidatus Desantisbacteria bacterium CG_4_10_14_3_um_filter_40_18]PJB30218.1 MAG: 50S ribosomal protein L3 [Candidatus Desantisbacteria bacterium CG_4_9_14_3_um_filter_40_11]
MAVGLLGRKIGMTQIFDGDRRVVPITVIKTGQCVVVQKKTKDTDGYDSIQVGFEDMPKRLVNKPVMGHFEKKGLSPKRVLREFRVSAEKYSVGDVIDTELFKIGEFVDIVGTTKGKGFAGVIKRHGFSGGKDTHGSMFHRAPGSIGQSSQPSRTLKGTKLPGRMGNARQTVKNLKVVGVDKEQGLILVRGAVPGIKSGLLTIKSSVKNR